MTTMPEPDPEAVRMAAAIRTAIATDLPDGDGAPALAIAEAMIRRGLSAGTAPQLVAMQLIELTNRYYRRHGTIDDDPYGRFARRLVDDLGVITQRDLTIAVLGRVMDTGLTHGWLDAEWYDRLAAFGDGEPDFKVLLSRIERRERPTEPGNPRGAPKEAADTANAGAGGPLPQWAEIDRTGVFEATAPDGTVWRMWRITDPKPADPFPAGYRLAPRDEPDNVNYITAAHGLYAALDTAGIRIAGDAIRRDPEGARRRQINGR